MRGGGDDVRKIERRRMIARNDQSRYMRHVYHKQRAHFIGNFFKICEIDYPTVCGSPRKNEFRLTFTRLCRQRGVIDQTFLVYAVKFNMILFAAETDARAVR